MMTTKRPIRLGVFFDQALAAGGGAQQAVNAVKELRGLSEELCVPVLFATHAQTALLLRESGLEAVQIKLSKISKFLMLIGGLVSHLMGAHLLKRFLGPSKLERLLCRHEIDLVYFTSPSWYALTLRQLNFIFTVWDLCHRDQPEFPEVREITEFQRREHLYRSVFPRATALMADSPLGKDNIVRRYGVDGRRVHVLPFSPAQGVLLTEEEYREGFVDIKEKYKITDEYIFYPAQFWPHKNHIYLLLGLKALEETHGIRISAVLSGGNAWGNRSYVEEMAANLGLSERVFFAGFVDNEEMPYLYKQSLALVMPSYFGPTNLPPLEAFRLGVPVLYSDKEGMREQAGDAAMLMDLTDPQSMADHLHRLITDDGLREEKVRKGRVQLESLQGKTTDVLEKVLRDFQVVRQCWR